MYRNDSPLISPSPRSSPVKHIATILTKNHPVRTRFLQHLIDYSLCHVEQSLNYQLIKKAAVRIYIQSIWLH